MHLKTIYFRWNNKLFFKILKLQDATILPIKINGFTICKTDNRMILSLMNNVDVLATSIPSYRTHKDYCFLDRWEEGLNDILHAKKNKIIKLNRIKKAKNFITKHNSLEVISNKWLGLFKEGL